MSNIKGRGVKVEIAATFAAAKTVSAIAQASPGVATSTSHGLANDTVGYFSGVSGMVQLEGQAGRVKNQATNTFEIQGLNTTNYSAFSGTCSFTPAATWATMSECTGYSIGGGASDKLDATTLASLTKQEEAGLLPAQSVSFDILAQGTPSAAMTLVESAVQTQGKILVRITLASGDVRIMYGEPSLPGEDLRVGALGTGSWDMTVKGFALKLAA